MVRLALDDIQGNILRGYRFPKAAHLFLSIGRAASARAFLRDMVDGVTSAAPWDERPKTATNVAVTYAGLRALGVDEEILSSLPAAFREPMRQRAPRVLDDTGPSAPKHWDEHLRNGRTHFLVLIAARARPDDGTSLTDAVDRVSACAEQHGLEVMFCQDVADLSRRREHFGWADGLGQPAIEGVTGARAGGGVPEDFGEWRSIRAGEFVHGYEDEAGHLLTGPATPLLRNGSYMVYRKLEQDVVAFRDRLYREAQRYGDVAGLDGTPDQLYELMAAKVVGRWRNGTPIMLHPRRDDTKLGDQAVKEPGNDFRYADDPEGLICPKGAHIRRANPRDADGAGGTRAARHRIIRRGMAYGPYLRRTEQDDGSERGLVFICFNADFERQFETIQARWCNDGNAFGLGDDRDYLLAAREGSGKVTIPGRPPYFAEAQPALVTTRGCEYLLMPGINALRDLAEPRPGFGRP